MGRPEARSSEFYSSQKVGDWYCLKCGHFHQAKADECKRCGAPNPITHGPPPGPVKDFLGEYKVDRYALELLFGLKPEQQQFLIAQGVLADAHEPGAVIVGRVKEIQNKKGDKKGKGKGKGK